MKRKQFLMCCIIKKSNGYNIELLIIFHLGLLFDTSVFVTLLNICELLLQTNIFIIQVKGTGRSEEIEISRNITFSEKILIESCGI